MENFLRGVVNEVLGNRRISNWDNWLREKSSKLQTNRDIAWLLYSIVFYYHDNDIWYNGFIRNCLQLPSHEVEQIKTNNCHDIVERKYQFLISWKQRQAEQSVEDMQRSLKGMKIVITDDGIPSIPPSITKANARDDDLPDVEEQLVTPSTSREDVSMFSNQRPTQRVTPIQQETSMSGNGPSIERGYPVQQAADSSDDRELDLT